MISSTPHEVEALPYVVMSTVKPQPINWLWKPYIPRGAVTTIIGDGGYGKSFMTCSIAADLSAGRALPGQDAAHPQKVLMISAEDGIGQVMLPRLTALEANMENIAAYDEGFSLNPKMAEKIAKAVEQFDAAVVFLDPMVVYMGGEIDSHKANEVRSIMSMLTDIAKHKGIAIVAVHHVNKGNAKGQHKSLGSVDFINSVRSTLLVDVSKTSTYYMSHVKHNWSGQGPTLAYSFTNDKFQWLGEYAPQLGELYEVQLSHTPRGKAKAFLLNVLKDGPVLMTELMKFAKDQGFSERTLMTAKRGVCHSVRRSDMKWEWELDEDPHPEAIGQTAETLLSTMAQGAGPEPRIESEMERLMREAQAALVTTRKAQGAGRNEQDAAS